MKTVTAIKGIAGEEYRFQVTEGKEYEVTKETAKFVFVNDDKGCELKISKLTKKLCIKEKNISPIFSI